MMNANDLSWLFIGLGLALVVFVVWISRGDKIEDEPAHRVEPWVREPVAPAIKAWRQWGQS